MKLLSLSTSIPYFTGGSSQGNETRKKKKKLSTLRYVNICLHKNLHRCSYKHYSYQTESRNKSNLYN